MDSNIYSWQQDDYKRLCESYSQRILFIHSRDMDSPYHVFSSFYNYMFNKGHIIFTVSKSDPHMINPLLPFSRVANDSIAKSGLGKNMTRSIFKDLTHSDTLAQLAENIKESGKHTSLLLSGRENDLMARLEYASNGFLPVFVFCGYPHFDSESKNLTSLLLSGVLDSAFLFLNQAKYIFLCEIDDGIEVYQSIKRFEHIDIVISEPTIDDTVEIVADMIPALSLQEGDSDKVFHLAGGRLSVIEIIARYLSENSQAANDCTPENVVCSVLENRLERMGHQGNDMKNVLETAAVIGDVFDILLLKQTASQVHHCDMILKKSEQEYLTICNGVTGSFRYKEIWNYFYRVANDNRLAEISRTISEAIYFLNPYDYMSRAYHFERAGMMQDACELYILSYNAAFCEGVFPQTELIDKVTILASKCDLGDYWRSLQRHYAAIQCLDFNNALNILEDMPTITTPRLLLLKEYLTGLCTHRAASSQLHQKDAILAIEKASEHAKKIENGIWCDCQMVLISFYMNYNGDISRAKAISKDLTFFYADKMLAPYAQKGIHALERKYSALYSVERAVVKTQSSVEFFRNSIYPAQYLMALNNHSANLIVLGKFAEASMYLNEALAFVSSYKCTNVNLMYLLNNYCLCAVLDGRMEQSVAHEKIMPMIREQPFGDWKIILELNCAIYKACTGDLEGAKESLYSLETLGIELSDDYYLYYIYANLSAIFYLQGHADKAVNLLTQKCAEPPALMKETEKHYLRERSKQWKTIMESTNITDPVEFDKYLLEQHAAETQWSFVGRGFLYSDIQFWSEP